jgi:hypothetical protein
MQEAEERKILSLEDIKTKYPPQTETFGEGKIQAEVSRNEEGVIVYVVPGSTKKTA